MRICVLGGCAGVGDSRERCPRHPHHHRPSSRRFGLGLLALSLHRGLQFGRNQLVILGAQVNLLGVRDGRRRAVGGAVVAEQVVLALELLDLLNGDLELVGHPSIGTTLSYPTSDLV